MVGFHVWYSHSQAKVAGYSVYRKPDGSTYQVTVVSPTPEHGCKWDDMVYLGTIGEDDVCVGSVRPLDPKCAVIQNMKLEIQELKQYKPFPTYKYRH